MQKNKTPNSLKKLLIEKVVPTASMSVLVLIGTLYFIMFYLFGWAEVIIHKDIQIYNSLIFSSFSLGGFSMTVASFLLQSKNKKIKNYTRVFLLHSSLFILSGALLFSSILIAEITKYIPEERIIENTTINNVFKFFLILGTIGLVIFFIELSFLTHSFVEVFSFLKK